MDKTNARIAVEIAECYVSDGDRAEAVRFLKNCDRELSRNNMFNDYLERIK